MAKTAHVHMPVHMSIHVPIHVPIRVSTHVSTHADKHMSTHIFMCPKVDAVDMPSAMANIEPIQCRYRWPI